MAQRGGEAPGKGPARRRDRRLRLPPRAGPRARIPAAQGRDRQKGLLDVPLRRGRPEGDERIRVARPPGSNLKAGDLVTKVADLKPDGSTSSGAWLYAGVFAGGVNLSKRRDSKTDPGGLGLYPNFAWTWPNNMRVLYNRASCDRNGKPYPGSKPIVWWDEKAKPVDGIRPSRRSQDHRRPRHAQRPARLPHERGRGRAALRGRVPGPRRQGGPIASRQPDPPRRGLRAQGRSAAGDVRARREPGRELPASEGQAQPDAEVSAREVAPADRDVSTSFPTS